MVVVLVFASVCMCVMSCMCVVSMCVVRAQVCIVCASHASCASFVLASVRSVHAACACWQFVANLF